MYERESYEVLLKRMLEKALTINNNLDTREGSLVFLANAPAAVELQNLYIALDTVLNETFADTASRDYLILRAAERGISPNPTTFAVLEMTITPTNLNLPIGTRFSMGELNYAVTNQVEAGVYEITCEQAGERGNDYGSTIIPVEYVKGLESCTVTALLVPGEDEEDTESLRKRYFDSLNTQAFGGNQADYIQKVNQIAGVGGVRTYRAWNSDLKPSTLIPPSGTQEWIQQMSGMSEEIKTWVQNVFQAGSNGKLTTGGSVKLVIIDSTYAAPSAALIELVQQTMDPVHYAGEGAGWAPIGHLVKVYGVDEESVNISLQLAYQSGVTWEHMQKDVEDTIREYFSQLSRDWAEQQTPLVVRVSQIESRLLQLDGIVDVMNTTLNGVAGNFTLNLDAIPILGTIQAEG